MVDCQQETILTRLKFDDSKVRDQLKEMAELLATRFPHGSDDGALEALLAATTQLVASPLISLIGDDGVRDCIIQFEFGSAFRLLMRMIRDGGQCDYSSLSAAVWADIKKEVVEVREESK